MPHESQQGNSILHATILASPIHAECPCKACRCCCFINSKCAGQCNENGHEYGDEEADDWDDDD